MCLSNISKDEEKEILNSLPNTFPCWKALRPNDETEFSHYEIPLKRGRTYIAGYNPATKALIKYEPGFHAFLYRKDAIAYQSSFHLLKKVKFWAKKEDIIKIGDYNHYPFYKCVCVRRITRK